MEMADATQESVIETFKELETSALAGGWGQSAYGWICPYCVALPGTLQELAAETTQPA